MFQKRSTASPTDSSPYDERTATATYVATLTAEMATIARQNGLPTLGYVLDMARLEAESTLRARSTTH